MKDCPKCGNTHEKPGKFCSRSCANTRVVTEESNRKRSASVKKYWETAPEEHRAILNTSIQWDPADLLQRTIEADFDTLGERRKKKRILHEQNDGCLKCQIKDWMGEPISFELDHIDGDKKNNSRSNLRVLCPNCHSQTPTWRGKQRNMPVTL